MSKKQKLTPWSKPGEVPPSVGVWMASFCKDAVYRYWNGGRYGIAGATPDEAADLYEACGGLYTAYAISWRGLAEKPE